MKLPLWKKWWSYVSPISIETRQSAFNPLLEVQLSKGRYCLLTENAIYSFADLYTNFSRVFQKMPLDKLPEQDVLVLGLGMGSIPYMLEKTFQKKYYYTCVEIDAEVIDIANQYLLKELKSGMEIVEADAFEFIWWRDEPHDIICVDLFLDILIPDEAYQAEFLERLEELLNPNGFVIYNCSTATKEQNNVAEKFYETVFKSVFPNATCVNLPLNKMLINRPLSN